MKNSIIIILLFLLILFAGCSAKFTMTGFAPPNAGEVELKTVSVLPFEGEENSYFSDTLLSILGKLVNGDEPVFELVPEGGEGVFSGEVTYEYYSLEVKKERDTKPFFGLKSEIEVCVEHNYDLTVNINLTDAEDGEIPYARDYARRMTVLTCPEGRTITMPARTENLEIGREISPATADLHDINPPYTVLSNSILESIAKDLGSYIVITRLDLAKPDKALSKDDRTAFKKALSYMKKDNRRDACMIWKDLYDNNDAEMPGINFNLGVCFELAGRYDEALAMYRRAAGEKMAGEAVNRVETKKDRNVRK